SPNHERFARRAHCAHSGKRRVPSRPQTGRVGVRILPRHAGKSPRAGAGSSAPGVSSRRDCWTSVARAGGRNTWARRERAVARRSSDGRPTRSRGHRDRREHLRRRHDLASRNQTDVVMKHAALMIALITFFAHTRDARAQARDSSVSLRHDSVSVHLVDADIRAAVEALAPYLDRPVGFGSAVPGARVTLETPAPVARTDVRGLLEGLLESQNLELVRDSAMYRVQAKAPPPVPAPQLTGGAAHIAGAVQLFVIRLKHARAADVAATVNALFGRASALGEPGATRPATLDQQLQTN